MEIVFLVLIIIVFFTILLLFLKKKGKTVKKQQIVKISNAHQEKSSQKGTFKKNIQIAEISDSNTIDAKAFIPAIIYFQDIGNTVPSTIDELDEETKKSLSEKVSIIPPIPATSLRLLNLLRNPHTNTKEIASLASTHPVFSAKLLQTANSAYFSLPEKITSVGRAITLLGYNNVRALVIQDGFHNMINKYKGAETEIYIKTWVHSAIVSVCAGSIGKRLFQLSEYDLSTIGLLHDIGKFFLFATEGGIDIISDIPSIIKEEHRYGVNHAVAGSYMASQWQLPDIIVKCIEYHHAPAFVPPADIPNKYLRHSLALCLADTVTKALGYKGQDEQILPIRSEYYEMFGLNKDLNTLLNAALMTDIEKTGMVVESYVNAS